MRTYNSTIDSSVNEKSTLKCKRYLIDPVTNRLILNPEWTAEQEAQVVALTKPKIPFRLKAPLEKIRKCQIKKEIPALFKNQLTSKQALDLLDAYAQAGQNAKINTIGYLSNLIVIHKFKKLYPTQGHIAKVLHISRGWENETLSALEKDGLINSLFRFLCSKCYSVSMSLLDPEFRERFSKFFPWIKYHENKAAVAEFTYNINLGYIYNNLVDNVIVNNVTNFQKGEIPSKTNSRTEKNQNSLTSILSVLCTKMKAF